VLWGASQDTLAVFLFVLKLQCLTTEIEFAVIFAALFVGEQKFRCRFCIAGERY
jgi:hypothetical protein